MKRTVITLALILILLSTAMAGTVIVNVGKANPYFHVGSILDGTEPAPEGTNPPEILFFCPTNDSFHDPFPHILLNFSVSIENSNGVSLRLSELYYTASWKKDKTEIGLNSSSMFTKDLWDVPEGSQWLTVYAVATGYGHETGHSIRGIYYVTYYVNYIINGSSTVRFTVDRTIPKILSLSLENKMYATSDVPLTLTTSEPVSHIIYNVDGQTNVTASSNTTLTGIPYGMHKLTIYVADYAGHVGAPKTVYVDIFPTAPVVASIAAAVIVGVSLLVYFRNRKRKAKTS
jgi:hypothetical protein